jgi:hypothetical protein
MQDYNPLMGVSANTILAWMEPQRFTHADTKTPLPFVGEVFYLHNQL